MLRAIEPLRMGPQEIFPNRQRMFAIIGIKLILWIKAIEAVKAKPTRQMIEQFIRIFKR